MSAIDILPEWHEWHGVETQSAPIPPALIERIGTWREVFYILYIPAFYGDYWQVSGIQDVHFVCLTLSGSGVTEHRMPMFAFKPMKPWEIDRLRA